MITNNSSYSLRVPANPKKLFSLATIFTVLMVAFALGAGLFSSTRSASAAGFGDANFQKVFNQGDGIRVWGNPGWIGYEGYDQARPNGNRMVQYFDKSRMEINDPGVDRNSQWFVSNGLLTMELVSGKMQVGDNRYEQRSPANIPVAGDLNGNGGPTYAALGGLTVAAGSYSENRTGQSVNESVNPKGQISQGGAAFNTTYAYYVPDTRHNIPGVLWNWMQNIPGTNWTFALGYPISEAYWSWFRVGGQDKPVLVQLFQRRVLTFTPSNDPAWQVEMGNIGMHYFNWRYSGKAPNALPAAAPSQPVASNPAPAQPAASSPLDGEEQIFVNLINDYRRANGLSALAYQPNMGQAASWMSKDMAEKNYFSHTDSLGRDPFKRMADFSYKGGWMGENIAAGKESGGDTFNQFRNSPGHNANMLKPEYKKIGVARHFVPGSTYGWYWTVDFGD